MSKTVINGNLVPDPNSNYSIGSPSISMQTGYMAPVMTYWLIYDEYHKAVTSRANVNKETLAIIEGGFRALTSILDITDNRTTVVEMIDDWNNGRVHILYQLKRLSKSAE